MILIVDRSRKDGDSLAEIFRYMGVLAYATSPRDMASELSCEYSAALIVNPTSFADIEDFTKRVASYSSDIPIFAFSDERLPDNYINLFAKCFTDSLNSSQIAEEIIDFCKRNGKRVLGKYLLSGIDASADREYPVYFDTPLPFTKTETMILRYLTVAYPTSKTASKILKYAFKTSRSPELSAVRAHISVMNRKFRALFGRKLIEGVTGEGYSLITAEKISHQKTTVLT